MKKIVLFSSLILCQMAFSQQSLFGIIVGKEDYVDVYQEASAQSLVKGSIKSGGVVNSMYEEAGFRSVEFQSGAYFSGFVPSSALQSLEKLPKISLKSQKKNQLTFANEAIEIQISLKDFTSKEVLNDFSTEKGGTFYKGKPFHGTDLDWLKSYDTPFAKYETIHLKINGKKVQIPKETLEAFFNVRSKANQYDCYWDKERNRVFIETGVGDGYMGKSILFIIENEAFKEILFWEP